MSRRQNLSATTGLPKAKNTPAAEHLECRRLFATIVVTNPGDTIAPNDGVTLREAITASNTNAPSGDASAGDPSATAIDRIEFNIPAGGSVATIRPTTPLPQITDSVVIDGYTQAGAKANTNPLTAADNAVLKVELDGSLAPAGTDGLFITAGSTTVRGLVINRFKNLAATGGNGIAATGGVVIDGNFIGTNAAGTAALANGGNGINVQSGFAQVGSDLPAARNVISGNTGAGVRVDKNSVDVLGNFIGLAADGFTPLGNVAGGVVGAAMTSLRVGGSDPGEGNVISGNLADGVAGGELTRMELEGNIIGLAIDGLTVASNGGHGVSGIGANIQLGDSLAVLFGVPAKPGSRNIISGNSGDGVHLEDAAGNDGGAVIIDAYVGTDRTGTQRIGNGKAGFASTASDIVFIKDSIFSGNQQGGISVGKSESAFIQGNKIGMDVTGNVAMPNGQAGLILDGTSNAVVGGAVPALRNIISGNFVGMRITGGATRNTVQGNYIGLSAAGAPTDQFQGLFIDKASTNNTIGGSNASAGNVIVNRLVNVQIEGVGTVGNSVRFNQIYGNNGAGVGAEFHLSDSLFSGTLPNDPGDADAGPNNQQNWPLISNAVASGAGSITIEGLLNSTPNSTFLVDFYASPSLDSNGHAEARTTIGTKIVTTDATGNALINATFLSAVGGGQFLVATATTALTAPYGDTSEFSPAINVFGPPSPPPPGGGGGGGGGGGAGTAVLGADPGAPGKTALLITGTEGNDVIDTGIGSSSSFLKVSINGTSLGQFNFNDFSRIVIDAKGGDDQVAVTTKTTKPALVIGGGGNDTIKGGLERRNAL